MTSTIHVTNEYRGLEPPPGVRIPTPEELIKLCVEDDPRGYNMGLTYPPEEPVFWIKYGYSVIWNEIPAQVMVHRELQRLGSFIRVPGIFYACEMGKPGVMYNFEVNYKSYIVMEYVPGKTAAQLLEDTEDPNQKEHIYQRIASALSELHLIPVPPDAPPAAIDDGCIRHCLFDMQQAPRQYQTTEQLELHLNLSLTITKRKERPMIFCYSNVWLANFIIDEDDRITVVDFTDASILPSSFSKYVLVGTKSKIGYDMSTCVKVPQTAGIDNTSALLSASGPMVMGASSFVSTGRRIPGGESQTQ
ncbi:hypothetical protein F5884DRAFT_844472 [Xylogone sp. PMI_703]|nr:hypothetical protein F5884DRAFT_844472 [Xylogone sp. PMI_703]